MPDMTPAPISVDRLRELLAFLDGSGQLDGRSFGDDGPIINGIRRNYWWRADLRHIATLLHQLAERDAELEKWRDAVHGTNGWVRKLNAAERAREESTGLLRKIDGLIPGEILGTQLCEELDAFLAASGGDHG